MNKAKLSLTLILAAIAGFVLYTFSSTGFFKNIENRSTLDIIAQLNIVGAEDIAISNQDSFAIISSTSREKFPAQDLQSGNLYLLKLNTRSYIPQKLNTDQLTAFAPHGISLLKKDSSYLIFAVNHVKDKHSIEVFELIGDSLSHKNTLSDESMISPNDVVALDENKLYFTNDHAYTKGFMRLIEEYGGFAWGTVFHFDGKTYTEIAGKIAYANGINIDEDRALMYVAAPRSFGIHVYDMSGSNIQHLEFIDCGTGVDNIDLDENGELWIGAHPDLLHFAAYAKGKKDKAPSEIIHIEYKRKGDYTLESIFLDDGQLISGTSVAARFDDKILLGTVKDHRLLILKDNAGN